MRPILQLNVQSGRTKRWTSVVGTVKQIKRCPSFGRTYNLACLTLLPFLSSIVRSLRRSGGRINYCRVCLICNSRIDISMWPMITKNTRKVFKLKQINHNLLANCKWDILLPITQSRSDPHPLLRDPTKSRNNSRCRSQHRLQDNS